MARQVRERGMNAALASGEAGVGEIKPARSPLKATQLVVGLVVAVAGASAGFMTYRAVASPAVTFTGEVTPATTYNLDFPATGIVMTLTVHTGDHVKAGQILATQDSTVAAANVAAAQAAEKADAALVAADQAPQTPAATAAAQQLDVAKAQSAVSSAQAAITMATTKGQNLVATQQAVVNGDQKLLDDDTARYTQSCTAASAGPTATPAAHATPPAPAAPVNSGGTSGLLPPTPQSLPKPTASSTASPRRSPSHAPSTSASASTPASPAASATGPSELCATLQSAVDRDNSSLAQANASLASIQSSDLAQQQQDAGNLAGSQAVLADAQQLVASQGAAPTAAVIAQAQSQLAAAQAQLAADQVALRQTSITAPADGVVAETAGAVGDIAGSDGVHNYAGPAGQPGTLQNQQSNIQLFAPVGGSGGGTSQTPQYSALITLYSGSLNVTAQLPESQMTGIRIGQNASLEITAAGVTVPGRIYLITTVPTNVSGSTYYDVTFTMDRPPAAVVAGMSVTVSLS